MRPATRSDAYKSTREIYFANVDYNYSLTRISRNFLPLGNSPAKRIAHVHLARVFIIVIDVHTINCRPCRRILRARRLYDVDLIDRHSLKFCQWLISPDSILVRNTYKDMRIRSENGTGILICEAREYKLSRLTKYSIRQHLTVFSNEHNLIFTLEVFFEFVEKKSEQIGLKRKRV